MYSCSHGKSLGYYRLITMNGLNLILNSLWLHLVLIQFFKSCLKVVSLNNLFRYVCFLCKGKWVSALTRGAKLIALEHVCCLHPQTGYDGKYVWSMPHDLQISHHLTTKVGSDGSSAQGLVEFFLNFNRTSLRKDKCRCFE